MILYLVNNVRVNNIGMWCHGSIKFEILCHNNIYIEREKCILHSESKQYSLLQIIRLNDYVYLSQ